MTNFALMQELALRNNNKIVLLVMDGLGGLPMTPDGLTELEAAHTPNMDRLARQGTCGLSVPIAPGVTPGSGPAHLSLFGYDPIKYDIGRGVLEALGIGFDLGPEDLAARGNFCTVDQNGLITDRRAGRIPTETCVRLCEKLQDATGDALPGYQVFVRPVKEHRFALVLRGPGLGGQLTETDPLAVGKAPLPVRDESGTPEGARTAELVNRWIEAAREALKDEYPANSLNLRGLAKDPGLPNFTQIFNLRAGAIAIYPMYRGVAKLVGMTVLETGNTHQSEIDTLKQHWNDFDFFFVHIKYTDSRGEDGNFEAKVRVIEEVDSLIPQIEALKPYVLIVTGDHSTPAKLRSHSWHPVPTLLWSPDAMPDRCQVFGERECASLGGLGIFHATSLIPMALGHAGRLQRYGA
ncbi:MAG: 2,3-bisphosphoglycerate-independent phosphoglycerate mutase [Caldilineales bacterium]|nr:2,3-bisphosphoglycerate-independent phosphoglycerate mutase [Caldilineales bacterium]MDW8317952.1 2,3-bisphosphoglycerate-independent phosphoglycerate mutase [Anaerolineae bacterium]